MENTFIKFSKVISVLCRIKYHMDPVQMLDQSQISLPSGRYSQHV